MWFSCSRACENIGRSNTAGLRISFSVLLYMCNYRMQDERFNIRISVEIFVDNDWFIYFIYIIVYFPCKVLHTLSCLISTCFVTNSQIRKGFSISLNDWNSVVYSFNIWWSSDTNLDAGGKFISPWTLFESYRTFSSFSTF